jgi:bifunctional non-homologous end joining protein LigD
MLRRITPIAPLRIKVPFDDLEFIAELKHDGFRALAYIECGTCRLISRKQIVYKSFTTLCNLMAALPVQDAIFDGELICLGPDGRSMFMDLMRRRRQDVCYYAFDLLWLNGVDLRQLPPLDRKAQLRKLVLGKPSILYADHLQGAGRRVIPGVLRAGPGRYRDQSSARTVRHATQLAQGDQSKLQPASRTPGDV